MSKRYTAKQLDAIIHAILCNAFDHIETAIAEIKKTKVEDISKATPEQQMQIRFLNVFITAVNDVVHPAHKLAYKYFTNYHHMLDLLVKNHKNAIESKIVPECFNVCCDPDGSRSYAKAQEYKEKPEPKN